MSSLYPLRFRPTFRRYIWGGRRLNTVLQKPIGEGEDYAESWEVVDRGDDQSIVAYGPLEGMPLTEILRTMPEDLMGMTPARSRFPLLFKFLDANRDLSVQVHPNDEQAQRLNPPDLGKTEAWVIVDAAPDSLVYAGLKPETDRAQLELAVSRGETATCLHSFHPNVGDCIFIPAGTIHALGAGLLVAEIQQSSDTTFRLFDWNRVGADGQPRELHVVQALDTIDFSLGAGGPQVAQKLNSPGCERLAQCDKFVLDRWTVDDDIQIGGDSRFSHRGRVAR